MRISVIVPVAPSETALSDLLRDLAILPGNCEIILALPRGAKAPESVLLASRQNIRYHAEGGGRAAQMNAAARQASGEYLWFLHADSRLDHVVITALLHQLTQFPDGLFYADLAFQGYAPTLMRINQAGVWLRSHFLGMPFGDQGFCIQRQLFNKIGGYDENLPYGEDHVFVWRARQSGIKLRPLKACITTSARKYQQHGWLKTTCQHVWLTWKQAWPEWQKLTKKATKP